MEKKTLENPEKKERKVKPFTQIEIETNKERICEFPKNYDWDIWFVDFPELKLNYRDGK